MTIIHLNDLRSNIIYVNNGSQNLSYNNIQLRIVLFTNFENKSIKLNLNLPLLIINYKINILNINIIN